MKNLRKLQITVLLASLLSVWCIPRLQTFSEQAETLIENIRMPEDKLAEVPRVLQELELALNTRWPGCVVKPFGSTETGLVLKSSDIDVNVLVPDRFLPHHGFISCRADEIFKQFPQYVDIVTNDHVSQFRQVPSQIEIDVLFNELEKQRSPALLNYYFSLDSRVKTLAFIIKYWWKKIQIFHSARVIPNYGITLMLIFYLQQLDMLPSVLHLQKNAQPIVRDNWNSAFIEMEFKPRNETLYHLLGGFFEFYERFQYEEYIISAFIGRPVKRDLFEAVMSAPHEFEFYRRNVGNNIEKGLNLSHPVMLQEPFKHNENLASDVDVLAGSTFERELKRIADIYRKGNKNTFLDEMVHVPVEMYKITKTQAKPPTNLCK